MARSLNMQQIYRRTPISKYNFLSIICERLLFWISLGKWEKVESIIRNSLSQMFFKIWVLKNFPIFTGKYLCLRLFLIKLQAFQIYNFIKMRLQHSYLPVNIAQFLRTAFFREHLWSWKKQQVFKDTKSLKPFCSRIIS